MEKCYAWEAMKYDNDVHESIAQFADGKHALAFLQANPEHHLRYLSKTTEGVGNCNGPKKPVPPVPDAQFPKTSILAGSG